MIAIKLPTGHYLFGTETKYLENWLLKKYFEFEGIISLLLDCNSVNLLFALKIASLRLEMKKRTQRQNIDLKIS